jgi:polysaccharide export outer membrane protein
LGETTTGIYTLKRRTTLVEFLSQIGGLNDNADTSHVKLIKKDGKIFTYDFNELVKDPQKSEEVLVSGGDTLYVPPLEMNKVYVFGYVASPKALALKGKMTLLDAITEAGGAAPNAATKSIIVVRGEPGSTKGIRVNLDQILKNADITQNIELMAGDIIYVPKTFIVDLETFMRIVGTPLYWYVWFR